MKHSGKKRRRRHRRAYLDQLRLEKRSSASSAAASRDAAEDRFIWSDTDILRIAVAHGITPGGSVRKVQVTLDPLSPSAIAKAQGYAPEIGVSPRGLFSRASIGDEVASGIRASWDREHLDQTRLAARLLTGAASATRPKDVTCTVRTLASRLLRTAKFQGIPIEIEMCQGAVMVACHLERISLWPVEMAAALGAMWTVGIGRHFRFPGELPPPRSLVSSADFYRKRQR